MTEKKDQPERRQYVRIDCLMAGDIVTVNAEKPETRKTSKGLTKNISAGGLLFKDAKSYDIGQMVVVSVNQGAVEDLDKNLAAVIKTQKYVLGRIVRKEEFDNGNLFEYGVCFVRHDEEGLDYFNVFVNLINQVTFEQS